MPPTQIIKQPKKKTDYYIMLQQDTHTNYPLSRSISLNSSFEESYRLLSDYLEFVQFVILHSTNPYLRALGIILEEDLLSLVEECEETLVGSKSLEKNIVESFISRSSTVIEEVEYLATRKDLNLGSRGL